MNRKLTQAVAIAMGAALLMSVTGCGSVSGEEDHTAGSSAHGTRAQLYSGLDAMAADSSVVVVGVVGDQRVTADIDDVTDFTISSFEVSEVLKSDGVVDPGATIDVRQLGDEVVPVELLSPGSVYLLYLTASGLEGELASHYYVTGANAGIYQAVAAQSRGGAAADDEFVQVQPTEGEPLPEELSLPEALASSE